MEDDPTAALADLDAFVEREFMATLRDRLSFERCLYTVAPGEDFIIGMHPDEPRIVLGSPCSGHGFKHSAAVGEALAEMALQGRSRFDLSPFRLGRFNSAVPKG